MKSVSRAKTLFYIIISNFVMIESGRSIWRPRDPLVPEIITRWVGDKKSYHLCDNHLELYPLFHSFDHTYFMNHLIGDGPIPGNPNAACKPVTSLQYSTPAKSQ